MFKRITLFNNLWHFSIVIFLILIFSSCGKDRTELESTIKSLKGGFVFVASEKTYVLRKYDFQTGKSNLLISIEKDLEYPKSIKGKELLCKSKDGIYKFDGENLIRIFSGEIWDYCYLEEDKIAYITGKNYTLIVENLKNSYRTEILKESVNLGTRLTAFKDTLIFNSKDNRINKVKLNESTKSIINIVTSGSIPEIRCDGKKLAYLDSDNSELIILDMTNGNIERTGIKRIVDLTWIKDTNYLICKQWKSNFYNDWTDLEIVDYLTKEIFVLKGLRASGPGLAWIDF